MAKVTVLGSIDIKYFHHQKCYWAFWNCKCVCLCVCVCGITECMVLLTCHPEHSRNNSNVLSVGFRLEVMFWTSLTRRITCLYWICDKDSQIHSQRLTKTPWSNFNSFFLVRASWPAGSYFLYPTSASRHRSMESRVLTTGLPGKSLINLELHSCEECN